MIPQFEASIRLRKHFRFQETIVTAGNYTISRGNLLNLLFSCNSGTTSARTIAAVKVNQLEVWQTYSTSNTSSATTVSVEWLSNYGPSTEYSDTSLSVSIPAHVRTQSPPLSLASFWSITGSSESEGIFRLRTDNGSNAIIDLWVDIVLMDDETPVTITTQNSLTTSQLYAGYLDGQVGSKYLQPVSYTSAF
jgi:hypothetical protein